MTQDEHTPGSSAVAMDSSPVSTPKSKGKSAKKEKKIAAERLEKEKKAATDRAAKEKQIASDKAKFAELFVKRGLITDLGGLTRLPLVVGVQKAAELLFTGDVIDADLAELIAGEFGHTVKRVSESDVEEGIFNISDDDGGELDLGDDARLVLPK